MTEDKSHNISRFVDTEFDNKELPPICGYWSEKLVPLEQALKLIVPRIEQLDRSIKAAKKYCHFPSEHGLTHDQSADLYIHTMERGDNSSYRVLNQALRSENRPALKHWFPYLKLFDTAVSKLPTVKGSIWRGVSKQIFVSRVILNLLDIKRYSIRWLNHCCRMGKLKAASNSTSVAQVIKKESLPVAQAIKKESFSGECTSARTYEIHVILVKKTSTITIETKTV
jgi:hypothetical protein